MLSRCSSKRSIGSIENLPERAAANLGILLRVVQTLVYISEKLFLTLYDKKGMRLKKVTVATFLICFTKSSSGVSKWMSPIYYNLLIAGRVGISYPCMHVSFEMNFIKDLC